MGHGEGALRRGSLALVPDRACARDFAWINGIRRKRGIAQSANHPSVVLLQEMDTRAELDEPAIVKLASEVFRKGGRDLGARITGEEDFRIFRHSQRRMRLFDRRVDIGGLPCDRQLVRKALGGPPRLRCRERSTIDRHLLLRQLAQDRCRQDALDECVEITEQA